MKFWLRVMWLLICTFVGFCLVLPTYGAEIPKKQHVWHFGEGLRVGDEFTFDICDSMLRIPETDDHCYTITMKFLALLPTYEGMTWIVAVHADHKIKTADMIFQILKSSFKIKTDGTNMAYASSVERTISWIRQFSNENKPQILSVGKSWGIVGGDSNWPAQITVDSVDFEAFEDVGHVYLLGHSILKKSQIQIKDGFPFPLKAMVYKPIFSHQDAPLSFTFKMTSYQNADNATCRYVSSTQQVESQSVNDLLISVQRGDHSQNQNATDVEEFTMDDMLRPTNDNSTVRDMLKDAYGNDYGDKIRQSIHNFTKFIEMIANASNTILQSQIDQTNASNSD